MSFDVNVAPLVKFKVEGSRTSQEGEDVPFSFHLLMERFVDEDGREAYGARIDELRSKGDKHPITTAILERAKNWWDVKDGEVEIPFSTDAARGLLNGADMAVLTHRAYIAACGAKAKNF